MIKTRRICTFHAVCSTTHGISERVKGEQKHTWLRLLLWQEGATGGSCRLLLQEAAERLTRADSFIHRTLRLDYCLIFFVARCVECGYAQSTRGAFHRGRSQRRPVCWLGPAGGRQEGRKTHSRQEKEKKEKRKKKESKRWWLKPTPTKTKPSHEMTRVIQRSLSQIQRSVGVVLLCIRFQKTPKTYDCSQQHPRNLERGPPQDVVFSFSQCHAQGPVTQRRRQSRGSSPPFLSETDTLASYCALSHPSWAWSIFSRETGTWICLNGWLEVAPRKGTSRQGRRRKIGCSTGGDLATARGRSQRGRNERNTGEPDPKKKNKTKYRRRQLPKTRGLPGPVPTQRAHYAQARPSSSTL